jgi:hypothetical protein
LAIRAASPVRDLGLVDLIAVVVVHGETGSFTDRTVDIYNAPADSTDQMVMVVTDSIFETRRRSRRLNAADQAFGDQDAERVVHRLQRDRADLGAHCVSHSVCRDVGFARHRAQHGYPLGCYLNTALPKEIGGIRHGDILDQDLE